MRERPPSHRPPSPWPSNAPARPADEPREAAPRRNTDEIRIYGFNACMAVFAKRPHDLRKVYLLESRLGDLKAVLAWCVQRRLGYRVVESLDLEKLTQTQHHEGICFEVRRRPPLTLSTLLQTLPPPPKPALLLWLDGVGNPHNFGAVLRSAANFGSHGALLSQDSALALSGAAFRVAEGGAESVPVAQIAPGEDVFGALRNAEFSVAATVPREGQSLYAASLPSRLVIVLGAEGEGLRRLTKENCDLLVSIPMLGSVESLNVSVASGVCLYEARRRRLK